MRRTIGFDATAAVRQAAGIGRYTRELLRALSCLNGPLEYRLFYCAAGNLDGALPPLDDRFKVRALPLTDRLLNAVWYRLRIPVPVELAIGRFDLFHSPDFSLPPAMGRAAVLTIHDLAFRTVPACAYPTLRAYLEQVVPRSAARADRIIAVSESTRRDVIDHLGVPEERVTTIPHGLESGFRPQERGEAWEAVCGLGISEPFILSVGTLEPRKNYVRLLEAYSRLRREGERRRLVIAGARGWLYEPIFRRLRELRLEESVTFIRPRDRDLPALYSTCDAFVYPSVYEGFGMPALEALACGAVVTCSRTSSLPEVVGDAALTFDPGNVEEMADVLRRALVETPLRRDLRRLGLERAANFSWERTARATLQVYEEVLADA